MSADINLDNINVDLDLSGGADFGLDEIANALTTGIKADVGLANVGVGVTVAGALDVGLSNIDADVGLDDIRIKELPTIDVQASIKELPVIRTDSKVDLGLDDIRIQQLPPIQFELSFRPIRVHLPLNYSFCIELFGIRLLRFSVCGEGMAVAEDYHPHATERCG
jgi:hypothetical protein